LCFSGPVVVVRVPGHQIIQQRFHIRFDTEAQTP
jgi:hypothetical protein